MWWNHETSCQFPILTGYANAFIFYLSKSKGFVVCSFLSKIRWKIREESSGGWGLPLLWPVGAIGLHRSYLTTVVTLREQRSFVTWESMLLSMLNALMNLGLIPSCCRLIGGEGRDAAPCVPAFPALGFIRTLVSMITHTHTYIHLSVIILTTRRQCIPIYDPLKKKRTDMGTPSIKWLKPLEETF